MKSALLLVVSLIGMTVTVAAAAAAEKEMFCRCVENQRCRCITILRQVDVGDAPMAWSSYVLVDESDALAIKRSLTDLIGAANTSATTSNPERLMRRDLDVRQSELQRFQRLQREAVANQEAEDSARLTLKKAKFEEEVALVLPDDDLSPIGVVVADGLRPAVRVPEGEIVRVTIDSLQQQILNAHRETEVKLHIASKQSPNEGIASAERHHEEMIQRLADGDAVLAAETGRNVPRTTIKQIDGEFYSVTKLEPFADVAVSPPPPPPPPPPTPLAPDSDPVAVAAAAAAAAAAEELRQRLAIIRGASDTANAIAKSMNSHDNQLNLAFAVLARRQEARIGKLNEFVNTKYDDPKEAENAKRMLQREGEELQKAAEELKKYASQALSKEGINSDAAAPPAPLVCSA